MSDGRRDASGNGKDWQAPLISCNGQPVRIPDHMIRRVCSWCEKHLGGHPTSPYVSHGICDTCLEKEMKQVGV